MPSQLVINAQKDGRTVRSAGTENLDLIAEGLHERRTVPPDATRAVVTSLLSDFQQKEDRFVATDAGLENEERDDAPVRTDRDESKTVVSGIFGGLRRNVTAAHGEEAVAELGIVGRTPVDPQSLATLGSRVIVNLENWKERPSLDEDVQFKPLKWADRLREPVSRLQSALDRLSEEERQAQQLRSDRDRAYDAFDDAHDATANILSALLEAIGRHDLADDVRRTRHKKTPKTAETPQPAPAVAGE